MKEIRVQEAKATLSAVVDDAVRGMTSSHHSPRQAGSSADQLGGMAAAFARSYLRTALDGRTV
jgi:hypothetical protein